MQDKTYTLEQVAAAMAADTAATRASKRVHACATCGASFPREDTAARCIPVGKRAPRTGAYHQASTPAQRAERSRKRALVSTVLTHDRLSRVMGSDEA